MRDHGILVLLVVIVFIAFWLFNLGGIEQIIGLFGPRM